MNRHQKVTGFSPRGPFGSRLHSDINSGSMALFYSADPVSLTCSSVEATKQWWIQAFGCKQAKVSPDWDETLLSDVALTLRGEARPAPREGDLGLAIAQAWLRDSHRPSLRSAFGWPGRQPHPLALLSQCSAGDDKLA